MRNITNFWREDTDENIVRSWLLGGTDGQTYPLNDRFLPRIHVPDSVVYDFGDIESEWDDIIGWKYDYKIDDPELEAKTNEIVKKLNLFIANINEHPADYFNEIVPEVRVPEDNVEYTPVNFKSFLNEADHEVWIHVKTPEGREMDIWSADFHGDYKPVVNELIPYYGCTLGDGYWIEMRKDPETQNEVPMLCVNLV